MIDDLEAKANEAFYAWEKRVFGDDSPLSDYDRDLFTTGFVIAKRTNDKGEFI